MSRFLLFFAVAASCAACASLLDFKEPTDKLTLSAGDAGDTAELPSSSSTAYAAPLDASTATDAGKTSNPSNLCACPTAVTSDWQGPFVVASTTDGSTPAACAGAYPNEAYLGFAGASAPSAACSCACGAPADVACSTPQTTFFSDAACSSSCQPTTALACTAVTSYSCDPLTLVKPKAMSVSASVPSGGACLPAAKVEIPPPTWSGAIRLCGSTTRAACGDAGCPAAPGASFSAGNRCVTKPGDDACPAGFPAKQLFHETADTRACTECTCGAPTNVICGANAATFTSATCTGTPATLVLPADCVAVTAATRVTVDSAKAEGGACVGSGGLPTGAFTEDAPTTVCCLE